MHYPCLHYYIVITHYFTIITHHYILSTGQLAVVFEALKDVDGAVKPLGYSTTMKNKVSGKCLIFPKLDSSFRMGVPEAEKEFKEYITAFSLLLLNVSKHQHQRQVVHVDLYPSNVLWDLLGDSNRTRIVDWDAATFIGNVIM